MTVHWPGLKLIQVGVEDLQPLNRVVITIEPEPSIAGVVILAMERLQ